MTYTSSPAASGTTITLNLNQTVTFNINVTGFQGSTPTGTVQYLYGNDSSASGICQNLSLSNGQASCSTNMFTAGTHNGTFYYNGDSNYTHGNTAYFTVQVNKASPSVSIDVSQQSGTCGTVYQGYLGTSTPGSSFSVTAEVCGSSTPVTPTGTMAFYTNGNPLSDCAAVPLSVTSATCNTTHLINGYNLITATYSGDSNYNGATSSSYAYAEIGYTPSINFTVPTHHTLDQPFSVSATSTSPAGISYSVNSGPATISGGTVTLSGTGGTVQLTASQAASGSYFAGSQSTSFNVVAGSVWLGANQNYEVAVYGSDGAGLLSLANGGLGHTATFAGPQASGIDASGNYWVATSSGVSWFNWQGAAQVSSLITSGGIATPVALAIDGNSNVWLANQSGTISVLSNTGSAISPSTGYPAAVTGQPASMAIDLSGNVWVTTPTSGKITEILGAAAPVAPASTALANGTTGVKP